MRKMIAVSFLVLYASGFGLAQSDSCSATVTADVVALDYCWYANRLGAVNPSGQIYALRRNVTSMDTQIDENGNDIDPDALPLEAGNVRLKSHVRARPLILRVNEGECLQVKFENLLSATATTPQAGIHVAGLEVTSEGGILNDGSFVGANGSSVVDPGSSIIYNLFAKKAGIYFAFSFPTLSDNNLRDGLFGAVNVQPPGAEYYRSQVTRAVMESATMGTADLARTTNLTPLDENHNEKRAADGSKEMTMTYMEGEEQKSVGVTLTHTNKLYAQTGQPLINYQAEDANGIPYLRMTVPRTGDRELIYSDLTAIITGPNAGDFPYWEDNAEFVENPASPDRRQAYREFSIIYHRSNITQAFEQFNYPNLTDAYGAGKDQWGINYGFGGIGSEILANRLGVGPEGINGDEVDLKYEEFFLSSWAVGDPAMLVDHPANNAEGVSDECTDDNPWTSTGSRATKVLYPDDPSNVYHSYMRDHVKFRIANADTGSAHVHHQHAHQWLHSPNSSDGHYLDAQLITMGTTYTLEMVYNGSGNRNQTVGDSIFHCHFYPHFAAGMWSLWRVHDVFEAGTRLDANGMVATDSWNRALPDGEIVTGTPIPGLVPIPTIGMAPMPSNVRVSNASDPGVENPNDPANPIVSSAELVGRRVIVESVGEATGDPALNTVYENPGFPFFVPAVSGHRPVHPPLDFAVLEDGTELNGGLPRHQVVDGEIVLQTFSRWDFTRDFILFNTEDQKERTEENYLAGSLFAYVIPEDGTEVEKAAMDFHATRTHRTSLPNGRPGNFTVNGLPPQHGAPFADPAVNDDGNSVGTHVRYQGATIQMDVVLNKKGWHYPQQRILALWEDVAPTISGDRPPEPLFMRSATGDAVEYWHTNLVPNYYELDDFQVRTPTDIIGQHIHLVKFDVTSSDGATDGFNYEDATFSPDEVRERIIAMNKNGIGGILNWDPVTQFSGDQTQTLTIQNYEDYYPFGPEPAYQNWNGAQTTIQRWYTDPLLNDLGEDRTLRTVFTHDHLGPSTHQQIGLYAGLVAEPQGSTWFTNGPSTTTPGIYQVLNGDGQLEEYVSTNGYLPAGTLMEPFNPDFPKDRQDGGPTSWEAMIVTADPADSYREFLLEFGDMQLAFTNMSSSVEHKPVVDTTGDPVSSVLATVNISSIAAGPVTQEMIDNFGCVGIPLDGNSMVVAGLLTQDTAFHCELTGVANVDYTVYNQIEVNGAMLITDYFPLVSDSADCSVACDTGGATTTGCYKIYAPCTADGWADPNYAIAIPRSGIPTGSDYPGPTLISSTPGSPGTYSLNYRNEPIPNRVNSNIDPDSIAANPDENALDLSYSFTSIERLDSELNRQPIGEPINPANPTGFQFPANQLNANVSDYDPYTPLLNAYAGDKIQVRTLVGSHNNFHSFQLQGAKWYFEPSYTDSGYKAQQGMGISEHFEMLFDLPSSTNNDYGFTDYLYQPSSAICGDTNGIWGLLRAYASNPEDGSGPPDAHNPSTLLKLPNNQNPPSVDDPLSEHWDQVVATFNNPPLPFKSGLGFGNYRTFDVVAITAAEAYQSTLGITMNDRGQLTSATGDPVTFGSEVIYNPYGLIYVLESDLEAVENVEDLDYVLRTGLSQEPLILRAAAGDYIRVRLKNRYKSQMLCEIAYNSYAELSAAADNLDNGILVDTCIPASATVSTLVSGCAWQISDTVDEVTTNYTILRRANVTVGGVTTWNMDVYESFVPLSYVAAASSPFGKNTPDVCLTASSEVGFNPQLLSYDMGTSNGFNAGFNNNQTVSYGGETSYYWYAGNLEVEDGEVVATPVELGSVNLRAADTLVGHTNGLYAAMVVEPEGSSWIEDAGSRASATVFSRAQPSGLNAFLGLPQHGDVLFREFVLLYQEDFAQYQGTPSTPNNTVPSPSTTCGYPFNYKTEPQDYRYVSGSKYEWQSNAAVDADPQTPVFNAPAGLPTRVRLLNVNGACPQVIQLNGHSWQEEPWINDSTEIGDNYLSQQLGSIQMVANEPYNMVLDSAGGIDAVEGDYLLHVWLLDTNGGWGLMRVSDSQVVVGKAGYRAGLMAVNGWAVDDEAAPGSVALTVYDCNGDPTDLGSVDTSDNGVWHYAGNPGVIPTSISATLPDGTTTTATVRGGAHVCAEARQAHHGTYNGNSGDE